MTIQEEMRRYAEQLEECMVSLGLITIGEAAQIRGKSRSSIAQLIQRGRLKVEYILGRPYLYRAEIETFTRKKPQITRNTEPISADSAPATSSPPELPSSASETPSD